MKNFYNKKKNFQNANMIHQKIYLVVTNVKTRYAPDY